MVIEGKQSKKGWVAASIRKPQYNGLHFLAEKDRRSVTQILSFLLEEVGVPELTDEDLHARLRKLKENTATKKMVEVEAR